MGPILAPDNFTQRKRCNGNMSEKSQTYEQVAAPACPHCGGPLKPRQKYCSDKCRRLVYWEKQAARIADEVRAEVYEILIKKLVK